MQLNYTYQAIYAHRDKTCQQKIKFFESFYQHLKIASTIPFKKRTSPPSIYVRNLNLNRNLNRNRNRLSVQNRLRLQTEAWQMPHIYFKHGGATKSHLQQLPLFKLPRDTIEFPFSAEIYQSPVVAAGDLHILQAERAIQVILQAHHLKILQNQIPVLQNSG